VGALVPRIASLRPSAPWYYSSAGALVPRIILFGPAAPLCYSSTGFSPSIILFGLAAPLCYSSVGFDHSNRIFWPSVFSFYSDTDRCPSNLFFVLSMLRISRNMVAIRQFGCRMSNTKISPQLATLDGPVFVSSVLCQDNFHAYGMKTCTDGRIGCFTITGLRPSKYQCGMGRSSISPHKFEDSNLSKLTLFLLLCN
jgi:hypothetical protein